MIDLSVTRREIDKIDSEIVGLFEKRMEAANEVAKYKMETGKAVFDKEREDQKLDALGKLSHGEFNEGLSENCSARSCPSVENTSTACFVVLRR